MSSKQGPPPCQHTVESGDTFSNLALAYYRPPAKIGTDYVQ